MLIIYDLIFIIGFVFYLSLSFLKKKIGRHFLKRLGLGLRKQNQKTIWLHAVSVGEVNCLREFIPRLKNEFPNFSLVISTVTPTGNRLAERLPGIDYIFYLPFDLSFIVSRFIRLINPKLVIIVETEFWPNFIIQLDKRKVPIVIINGRISDRSYNKYHFCKFLFKNILDRIHLFSMQTQADAARLISLGVEISKVKVIGNMKFDIQQKDPNIRRRLADNEILLTCGSTHLGEESGILSCFMKLAEEFPNLRLLIAPRHIERNAQLKRLISIKFKLYVKEVKTLDDISGNGVFLVNVLGILPLIYSISDIVYIGASLVKRGGQNILEPAFFGKSIIIGRHYFNFRDIVELFKANNALIVVGDYSELYFAVRRLIKDTDERLKLGIRAKELLKNNRGASQANLELIKGFIKQ
ncbi:MAG: 3-deoxy-D-manno-octulosonic acid transferase [Candidatus Omnitrophota bacterium]